MNLWNSSFYLSWSCQFVLNVSFAEILQLKTLKGLALQDILTEVHLLIHRGDWIHTYCFIVLINHVMFPFCSQHPQSSLALQNNLHLALCVHPPAKHDLSGEQQKIKYYINSVFPSYSGLPSSSSDGSTGQTGWRGVSPSECSSEPQNQS